MLKVFFRFLVGPLVMLLSLAGIVHGVRAGVAQRLYFEARYGAARNDTEQVLRNCERAWVLYPQNYLFCSVATDSAFVEADNAPDRAAKRGLLSVSEKWCDYGLALNQYSRDLNLRKAGLLGAGTGGAAKAAEYWARYTDWHYWNPANQCILGRIYAWAGDFERAEACARLIAGSGYFAELRQTIDAEKAGKSGK